MNRSWLKKTGQFYKVLVVVFLAVIGIALFGFGFTFLNDNKEYFTLSVLSGVARSGIIYSNCFLDKMLFLQDKDRLAFNEECQCVILVFRINFNESMPELRKVSFS
jgi:hypothetical protein